MKSEGKPPKKFSTPALIFWIKSFWIAPFVHITSFSQSGPTQEMNDKESARISRQRASQVPGILNSAARSMPAQMQTQ